VLGPTEKLPPDYFNPSGRTPETEEMRRRVRESLEEDVSKFFSEGRGQVAIYDANVSPLGACVEELVELTTFSSSQNGTRAVRKEVREKFESMGINVFFIGV
jgi:6-phosphofructo-2-kinase / fructose-2,6-biphosphatase 4